MHYEFKGGDFVEAIKCQGLTFAYPNANKKAINNVDFCVNDGEFVLLIGKSAAGKSTLLKLLKKEISPVGELSGNPEINGTVGYVSQNVDESIVCDRVRAELSFGLTNRGMSQSEIDLLVSETASYFNLDSKLDSDISTLSGGERQMLNLASVMILKPDILLLDEPTSQLDPISAERFVNMIKRLHIDFGITVVMSQHNADDLFLYANSVALMDMGEMKIKSSVDAMIEYLKANCPEMLGVIPAQMRLFDGKKTVRECRQEIKAKVLNPIINDDKNAQKIGKIKNACFAYEKGKDVLDMLCLDVYRGKINAIIGANASGKTTLLKALAGVNKCYRGKVKFDQRVSMLCQNPFDLFTKEKCEDEVEFGKLTSFLEIEDIKNQHPYDLSGGQAGRLGLAKVLQTGAEIIVLDEPTKAFDPALKIKFAKIMHDLCDSGKTIILASHDIEFVGEYADYVSFLSSGKIVASSSRQEFFSSLNFYTTSVSRLTNGIVSGIVSTSDLENAGGLN